MEAIPPEQLEQRKPPTDRSGFLYRLGIYCIGIAIGFMILGMFKAKSAAEARRRAAEQAALETPDQVPISPTPSRPTQEPGRTPPERLSPASTPKPESPG